MIDPEVTIPQKCGGKGEPACPPIECVIIRDGVIYAKIAGVWYVLSSVTDEVVAKALTALITPPAADEGTIDVPAHPADFIEAAEEPATESTAGA